MKLNLFCLYGGNEYHLTAEKTLMKEFGRLEIKPKYVAGMEYKKFGRVRIGKKQVF